MVHPILRNRKITYYYLSLWLFAGTLPWPIMFYFYDGGANWFWPILLDALATNILLSGMSINYWYVVRYINIATSTPLTIIINHLVLGAVSTGVCIFISSLIVKNTLGYWEGYYSFMIESMPARFMMGLAMYSLVILLYYSIIFYYDLQEKSKQEAQLQTLMKEAELTVLKSQINPHFIFNSLNSISSLTIIRPNQAREMVIKLSEFLRYALDQDMKQKTMLANELENIKRYLEIEKIRFGERLKFELTTDKESEGNSLPNMILQPLLENAIKHGVHESTEPINIAVSSKSDGRFLNITIRNNYDAEVKAKRSSGIGIKNIQQRLQLIYGRSDLFKCTNSGNVFEVYLSFPQQ